MHEKKMFRFETWWWHGTFFLLALWYCESLQTSYIIRRWRKKRSPFNENHMSINCITMFIVIHLVSGQQWQRNQSRKKNGKKKAIKVYWTQLKSSIIRSMWSQKHVHSPTSKCPIKIQAHINDKVCVSLKYSSLLCSCSSPFQRKTKQPLMCWNQRNYASVKGYQSDYNASQKIPDALLWVGP